MELSYSQKQVINTKNKSLLVSASAGSGKTFVVIERIIESIKSGLDVSRLLVLTFTNAAASELKERLINRLYTLKEEYLQKGDRTNAVRIMKQISKVPMADISTIHAFCLNIIRNNFYTLGLDPNISTLDATKATIMLNDAISEVIDEEYDLKKEEFLDILDILGKEEILIDTIYNLYVSYKNILYNEEWLNNILEMYNPKQDVDLIYTSFGQVILSNIKNKLKMLKLELEYTIESLEGVEEFTSRKDMLQIILNNINMAINTINYDELYNLLPQLLDMPRLPSSKVSDEDLKEEIKQLKTKVSNELKEISTIMYKDSKGIIKDLNDMSRYIYWYVNIVKKVDNIYKETKKQKGVIDFSDYEHLAIKALEDENVSSKYKEKYEQIYIDEYQDTSNAQEAIIQKIAKKNNVIMVGDVKQSIYAFRNAKPELFTDKYNRLKEVPKAQDLDEAKIILAQNFRSRKEVLNSTNDIFISLMSREFGGVDYKEDEALVYGDGYDYSLKQDYKTEINIIQKESDVEQDIQNEENTESISDIEFEALLVAKRIRELVDNKFQVYDLKNKTYRNCEYKDIVILLRTVEGKSNIVSQVLSKFDIPCFADNKTGFYKSEEISIITSFLKVLDNPYDDIAITSIMYSIIGKFNLDEMAIIRNKNSSIHVIDSLYTTLEKTNNTKLKEKIENFLNLLKKFKTYLKTYKLADLILKLYKETGIYESLGIEKQGELKCANLDNFVEIVSEFEKGENTTSLYTLNKYLDVLKNKESAGDGPKILGENEDVVRIMTIHKSKGLEFPIVILMNLAQQYNEQDVKDKLQFDDELGIGIDTYDKNIGITYPSVIKQAIKVKSKKTLRAEALRLLYVALTRAKEKIIIYGTLTNMDKFNKNKIDIKNKETSELVTSNLNSHLKCILQVVTNSNDNFNVILHEQRKVDYNANKQDIVDRNIDKIHFLKQKICEFNIEPDDNEIEKLKNRFKTRKVNTETNKKYTVTELKKASLSLDELKPEMLDKKITSTSYGTFIHSIIEKLDYNKIEPNYVLEVVEKVGTSHGIINQINKKQIVNEIINMYNILRKYLCEASTIKNELEFVIKDSLKEIPDVKLHNEALIQGVVDMYIVTKDNKYIIVDFKTDKNVDENELLNRYSVQLQVYKRAIELAYNVKVDNTFIYSFNLHKLIAVGEKRK